MKKFLLSIGVITGALFVVVPVSAAEYEVQTGDSLWQIAKEHDTTVTELKEINQLRSNIIHPNQTLEINKEITYVVEKGDSLSSIAKKFEVEVEDIKEWNNLETNLIIIGEELEIREINQNTSEHIIEETNNESAEKEETPVATEPAVESAPKKEEKASTKNEANESIKVEATAYTAECDGCSGITATGINLLENPNMKVIAVDPSIIPLGTRVHVEGYGEAVAADTGGAIKGNKIDIHVPTKQEAYNWGRKTVEVTILN
ncbi:3D (Asp-Asp-Asp) domain-containing protein/LysM repeat protein [Gracilibacillus halotolerans]|uniref:3D (Asp-Asp-Asp) domain-containing protein/LysM repeat protein n=1 Tax=Gracilibacillus halotolerans TaxID=74386 RepID=A0A841RRQ7_9BACI|nr:3D domain-containing protein [Gracilibacillus halotolerans]MBB6514323.1 3D (Asp-Asp-Asp) domain-containing protein/LysM repeat protein [Gracilibacillus halotolerans]